MTDAKHPINPTIWDERHNPSIVRDNDGLTKREYFAGLAMQALIQNAPPNNLHNSIEGCQLSLQWADDLINALNK